MFRFESACRVCLIHLENKTHQISLYSQSSVDSFEYRYLLEKCTNMEISSMKDLPNILCTNCASDLVHSFEFIMKFIESNKILINALKEHLSCPSAANVENKFKNDVAHSKIEYTDDVNEVTAAEDLEPNANDLTKQSKEINNCIDKSNSLQCNYCDKQFSKPCYVIRHMRSHTKEKPFQCQSCDKNFTTKYSMVEHTQRRHSVVRECTCEVCGKQFLNKRALNQHARSHSNQANFQCLQCQKVFKFSATLSRHAACHAKQKDHCCNLCGKMFAHKQYLQQHLKATHSENKNFTCNICGKKMKTTNGFKSHNKLHSNEKPFSCDQCGMQFTIKIGLVQHFRSHHQSEKSGRCSICKKGFHDLEEHLHLHSREAIYQCDLCEQKFMLKNHLQRHIVLKHQNATKYQCQTEGCNKNYPLKFMLDYHTMKNHTKEPSHICPDCQTGFYRSCDLIKHSKMHNSLIAN